MNLVSRRYRLLVLDWWRLLSLGLLTAALALLTTKALNVYREIRSIGALRAQSEAVLVPANVRTDSSTSKISSDPLPSHRQVAEMNTAIASLNVPWRDVLDAIEAATPDEVEVLSVDAGQARQLRVEVRMSDLNDVPAYMRRLKRQPAFSSVVLTGHEAASENTAGGVRAQMIVSWRDDGRGIGK
jgi:Tfp pilus assembly protein PilN